MNTREEALDKIRKLLALANDQRANVQEAENAARMAASLMRKWNVDYAEAIKSELQSDESVVEVWRRAGMFTHSTVIRKEIPDWSGIIATSTGPLYDCFVRYVKKPEAGWVVGFYGYHADADIAAWTFEYLNSCVVRASREREKRISRGYVGLMTPEQQAEYQRVKGIPSKLRQRSFRWGMAEELVMRLKKLKKDLDAQKGKEAKTTNALVVLKEDKIKAKFGEFNVRMVDQKIKDPDGYQQGIAAAKRTRLQPNPIEGDSNAPLRLTK